MTARRFYSASDPEPSPPPPFLVLVWKPGADCHGAWHADDAIDAISLARQLRANGVRTKIVTGVPAATA